MKHYDGIIIGAGITGCSIAYFLTKQGVTNLLVIDKGGIASDITGICPGGVRQQWGTEINCLMAKRSVEFFQSINEHLQPEHPIHYRQVGYMYTFHSKETIANYQANLELQNRLGIPTKMLTPDEAAKIVPGINTDSFLQASFCETDGFVDDAYHVTNSFADAAKREGVQFITEDVVRLVEQEGRVTGVETAGRGMITADFVVNAAGLGSKKLAATIGVDLPITFEERRILYTNRIENRLIEPLLISFEKGFAAKQLTDGVVYMSYLGKDLGENFSMFDFQLKVAEVGMELYPQLEQVEFRTHVDGIYDSAPDHQAILGDVKGREGYFQAVGMSGHGFMMSPAIGEVMAAIITGKEPPIDTASLHFDRFASNQLVFEPSVV